jgi:predicted alpha-1,2-mannosidase
MSVLATGALVLTGLVCLPAAEASPDPAPVDAVAAVNPFIGTEETVSVNEGNARGNAAYGNTFPGATMPFGMVQNSPATYASQKVNDDIGHTRGGYEYNADAIRGFGLTRLSGTGCSGRFGGFDFPILPYTGPLTGSALPSSPADDVTAYYLPFSHDNESADPGYYAVTSDNGVKSELTATTRTAVDRFAFPAGGDSATLVLDAAGSNNDISNASLTIDPVARTVSGSVTAKIVCASGPSYTVYFSAAFDRDFTSYGTWTGSTVTAGGTDASTTTQKHGAGGWLAFAPGSTVTAHIGLSYVSVDGAAANLAAESASLGLDDVRASGRAAWEEALGAIDARGGGEDADTKFYTALYHALGSPATFEDADGRYTGYDGQVHQVRDGHHFYVNFSGWDTYRGQAQLIAVLEPQVASDVNQSIVDMVDQSGKWSSWPSYNQVQTKMSGDSLQVIVSATDAFGSTDYDRQHALESMVESQSVPAAATESNRSDAFLYTTLGWVNGDSKNAATSRTLEYATDDFAIAQLARRLGDSDASQSFSQRSQNWMNVFDYAAGHIDARNKNGFMNAPLNTQGDQYEQSTGNQYGFSVPFNMASLIQARGGVDASTAALDTMLTELDAGAFSDYSYLTNQPSFGLPWVYNWLQAPAKAADTLDRAVAELYGTGSDGLMGNDDLGSLSAWYVWANLGLYPGIYGTANLLVSSPMFDSITIASGNADRTISISAPGATSGQRHIASLSVDGAAQTASWLPESFARNGGTLDFTMTSDAAPSWGTGADDAPPSYEEGTDDRNGRGITKDGAKNQGTLDVNGATLSYERLAALGATPGASLRFGDTGVTFTWPDSADGTRPDHYIPHGQRLDVDDVKTSGISFLGLATNGPSTGNATVEYTDGTTATVKVFLSDWTPSTVPAGNTAVLSTSGRNTKEGGSDTASPRVFATDVQALDATKTVAAVDLPTIVDKGIMHIFAIGFQNPTAGAALATSTSLSLSASSTDPDHPVTATLTVAPAGAPGALTLTDGGTELGHAEAGPDGSATISVPTTLSTGRHQLTAAFVPADVEAYMPSSSEEVALTVLPPSSTTGSPLWSRSYEAGTPAPAGFPERGTTAGIVGETAVQPGQVAEVTSTDPNMGNIKEYVARLSDGDPKTKWYAAGSGAPTQDDPVIAAYSLTGARTVTGYSLTASGDSSKFPERDPESWQILGSNDADADDDLTGPSWTVLSSEADQSFAANGLTRFYRIQDPGSYTRYQLRITANAGGATKTANTQIADWTLSTDAGGTPRALGLSVRQTGTAPGGAGDQALRYAGRVLSDGPALSSTALQMNLDVPVASDTTLSYLFRPDSQESVPVSVDIVYSPSDGSEDEVLPGTAAAAAPGAWTPVTVDLSSLAGSRVRELRLRYEDPDASGGSLVSGWIDALTVGAPLVDQSTAWTYLDAPDVDPAGGAVDRTIWTATSFTPGDQWSRNLGPFGAKGTGTDLGPSFPVTTKLDLSRDGRPAEDLEGYFFRTTVDLDQPAIDSGTGLTGTVVFDDTATIYVNGIRAAGWNDSAIQSNIQYQTPDGTDGGADPVSQTFAVPASMLVAGRNTIAVEVHQCNSTSSDIYFSMPRLALDAGGSPLPYRDDQLDATYSSDGASAPDGLDHDTWLLRSFTDAEKSSTMGPNTVYPSGTAAEDLSAVNDRTVVDLNNAPTSSTNKLDPAVEEALRDGAGSPYLTMADGLGDTIGPLYAQALANNELPKTEALLSWRVEKPTKASGDAYQTAKDNYQYKRPFVRMGFSDSGGLIQKWDSANGYSGLAGDGSFPSGHTSRAYSQGITLATLLPELAPGILARTSEYANNRIVLAFHYPTDIMGGRIVGEDTTARRWSDPEYRELLLEARDELVAVLAEKCQEVGAGRTLDECAAGQAPFLSDEDAETVYRDRLTYGFPQVGAADQTPSVPSGASNLLLTAFPDLTDAQRTTVLAATGLPSGYVLDQTGDEGSYQRLDLLAAMTASVQVGDDGSMTVNGVGVDADGVPVVVDPVVVTPGEVTFTDRDGTADDTYTIPVAEGVEYVVDGRVVDPGAHPATGTVTVTARPAGDGYVLADGAAHEWSHTFSAGTGPAPRPSPTDPATPSKPSTGTDTGALASTGSPTGLVGVLAGLSLTLGAGAMAVRRRHRD